MGYEHLMTEERAGGVRVLTLNRPDPLNAWNSRVRSEMRDAVEDAAGDRRSGCWC